MQFLKINVARSGSWKQQRTLLLLLLGDDVNIARLSWYSLSSHFQKVQKLNNQNSGLKSMPSFVIHGLISEMLRLIRWESFWKQAHNYLVIFTWGCKKKDPGKSLFFWGGRKLVTRVYPKTIQQASAFSQHSSHLHKRRLTGSQFGQRYRFSGQRWMSTTTTDGQSWALFDDPLKMAKHVETRRVLTFHEIRRIGKTLERKGDLIVNLR